MKWPEVKHKREVPSSGGYENWKPQISEDCGNQCVYCAITEVKFGGLRNFHIDHYRPKSKFKELKDDINNLYLSCSVCNCFKSSHWNESGINIPDPGKNDFNKHIEMNEIGITSSKNEEFNFMIHKLHLNRNQLILIRREYAVMSLLDGVSARILNLDEAKLSKEPKISLLLATIARMLKTLDTSCKFYEISGLSQRKL